MDDNNGNGFGGGGGGGGPGGRRLDLVGSWTGGHHPGGRVRTLVADGVPAVRQGVRFLLSLDTEIDVIGEAESGPEALALIHQERPDLVILDAQLPRMTGLEVAARLVGGEIPAIVFLTAYRRETLDAFRAQALDYLLKPFEDQRFFDSVRRSKVRIRLQRTMDQGPRVLAAYRALSGGKEPPPLPVAQAVPFLDGLRAGAGNGGGAPGHLARLAVRDGGRVLLVDVDEIDWIEAADYYVQIHVGSRTFLHRETMHRLESQLDPARFIRIHRSAIVNQGRIRELRHQGRRDMVVVLNDGAELRVARSHRQRLGRAS